MNPEAYQVKAKSKDNDEWVTGYYCPMDKNEHIILTRFTYNGFHSTFIQPETICKCTGLKVQNDVLLFLHDILYETEESELGIVKWDEQRGMFYIDLYGLDLDYREYEVIDTYSIGDFTSLDHFEIIGNMKDGKKLYDLLVARELMEEEVDREGAGAFIPTYPR